jgi:anaerobic ribonucleoside-triphosphate reductase activating protein
MCILFTQGCNFRCPYCHNPELIEFKPHNPIEQEEVLSFLEKRRGKLDAVSITGGEPTLQPDLIDFLEKIKSMNYLIKLDSNGSHPEILEKIVEKGVVDYLAMDVKGPLKKYQEVVNSNVNADKIKESISLIMNSGLDYEFRTTVVKSQLSPEDIVEIGKQ